MMRNVALGAVIGFGVVVLLLSVLGRDAPPRLPPPIEAPAVPDAGATDAGVHDAGLTAPVVQMLAVPAIRTPLHLSNGPTETAHVHSRLMQQVVEQKHPDAGP